MSEPIKVWISKWALATDRVSELEAWDDGDGFVRRRGDYVSFKIGRDAHYTKEEAVAAACVSRDRKVAQLTKQIAKLRGRTFDAATGAEQ